MASFSETERLGLIETLEHDPRPAYQNDPDRIYGLAFAGRNIRFRVEGAVLSVLAVEKAAAVRERKL